MRLAIGLLALALFGGDAPAPPTTTQIHYDLKFLEVPGPAWRGELLARLQPVSRQGGSTVWTAPRGAAEAIQKLVRQNAQGRIVAAPKVTAHAGTPAHISLKNSVRYLGEMKPETDGAGEPPARAASLPIVATLRQGTVATISGRALDQGILAQVVLDDTLPGAMRAVTLAEVGEPGVALRADGRSRLPSIELEVPELEHRGVAGEWLIPRDGVLVISLGSTVESAEAGKANTRERLVVIEARPMTIPDQGHAALTQPLTSPSSEVRQASLTGFSIPLGGIEPRPMLRIESPARAIPMPAPQAPSRSLPVAVNGHGVMIPLPPLPEDQEPPTILPHSAEPCATPQTRVRGYAIGEPVPERPSTFAPGDLGLARAGVAVPACCASRDEDCVDEEGCCGDGCECDPTFSPDCHHHEGSAALTHPAPAPPEIPSHATRPSGLTFRVPLNGSVVLEVHAVARPHPGKPPRTLVTTPADALPVPAR